MNEWVCRPPGLHGEWQRGLFPLLWAILSKMMYKWHLFSSLSADSLVESKEIITFL